MLKIRGTFPIDHQIIKLYYRTYAFTMPKNQYDKDLIKYYKCIGLIVEEK